MVYQRRESRPVPNQPGPSDERRLGDEQGADGDGQTPLDAPGPPLDPASVPQWPVSDDDAEGTDAAAIATMPPERGGRGGRGDGRGTRAARPDLTTGSVPKKLANLAWPQVAESILNIADQAVDLVWAGRLPGGFRSIAALGVAQSFIQFSRTTRQGLDMSMQAMISRAVGSGNIRLASHVALQAFSLNAVYSVLMIIIGIFLTDVLLRVIGTSEAVRSETAMYMRIQFVGMATMSFRMMSGSALQASGDVMTPLRATTVARVVHITLTPFLMFGWLWFPSWGLAGAAVANVLAHSLGFGLNLHALFRGNSVLHLSLRDYRLDYRLYGRMIRIGIPASITATERSASQMVLLALVMPFGDVAVAAYALTRRVEMFTNFGSMGLGRATGIMVGQNLGADRVDRAKQSIGWGLLFSTTMKVAIVVPLVLFPAGFVSFFTTEPAVVELTSTWLRIMAIGLALMGAQNVFQQSFNIAGDTLAPMVVSLIALWGMEVPLAWLFAHGLGIGPLGIAYAQVVGFAGRVVFFVPYFFWGRWTRIKVI